MSKETERLKQLRHLSTARLQRHRDRVELQLRSARAQGGETEALKDELALTRRVIEDRLD